MLKNKTSLYFVLTVCALGCNKPPERVSIDLYSLTTKTNPLTIGNVPTPGLTISSTDSLPETPKRNLLVGSGTNEARIALDAARDNHERAYREALADLTRTLEAEAHAKGRQDSAALVEKYRTKLTDLYATLRLSFEKHAAIVGPQWVRLSTIAGFPDKLDQVKKLPPSVEFIRRKEAIEANEIRAKILKEDAQYRREVVSQVENIRQGFRLENSDLEAEKITTLDKAKTTAEFEAKKIASQLSKGLEESMVNEIERLAPVSGTTMSFRTSISTDLVPVSNGKLGWAPGQRLVSRAKLFAKSKGYELVEPGPGVKDMTKEFVSWEAQWDGH